MFRLSLSLKFSSPRYSHWQFLPIDQVLVYYHFLREFAHLPFTLFYFYHSPHPYLKYSYTLCYSVLSYYFLYLTTRTYTSCDLTKSVCLLGLCIHVCLTYSWYSIVLCWKGYLNKWAYIELVMSPSRITEEFWSRWRSRKSLNIWKVWQKSVRAESWLGGRIFHK